MADFLGLCIQIFEFMVLGFLPLSIALVAFVYTRAILKALRVTMKRSMEEGMKELIE